MGNLFNLSKATRATILEWAVLILGAVLCALLLMKATNLPIQDFEQAIVDEQSDSIITTWLTRAQLLLTDNLLWLRSPNLLAFGGFFYYVYTILDRLFSKELLVFTGVFLVSTNPYLLDYFTTNNGIAKSCFFLVLSMDAMLRYHAKPVFLPFAWAVMDICLALLENVYAFPILIGMLTLLAVLFFTRVFPNLKAKFLGQNLPFLTIALGLTYWLIQPVLIDYLTPNSTNIRDGFAYDTVYRLVELYYYGQDYFNDRAMVNTARALSIIFSIFTFRVMFSFRYKKRYFSTQRFQSLWLLLAVAIGVVNGLAYLAGIPFPTVDEVLIY